LLNQQHPVPQRIIGQNGDSIARHKDGTVDRNAHAVIELTEPQIILLDCEEAGIGLMPCDDLSILWPRPVPQGGRGSGSADA
jgi:hypothetical protein